VALFPQSFIDEVRSAADIVTVISDYVSLRKAGVTYKGLCPFHAEKSPSFSVNRDRGLFYCFGCQAGGDVFKFIELQEKLNFTDAVRQLAQRFGIPIPEVEPSAEQRESSAERESLLRIHEVAAAYFREQLHTPAAERIRAYLADTRKLTAATVETLGLGFAPPSRDGLRLRLLKEGFPRELTVKSGLVTRRDDGSEIDRFRNRLMVPIARDTGSVIAFGGRALEKDQVPKYLNSPETPIYSKSRTLYGLNLTKGEIRKANVAIIVEGYFDFAQVFQAGGLPAVASCGTALISQQAHLLHRFASKTVLCYDPDAAGLNAARRGGELLLAEGFEVSVAMMPGGLDPDSFVQAHGREGFVAQLRQARPFALQFSVDQAASGKNLDDPSDQRAFVQEIKEFAHRVIRDPVLLDQLADRVAVRAHLPVDTVRTALRVPRAGQTARAPAPAVVTAPLRDVERGLLWAIVHTPEAAAAILRELEPADLEGLRSQDLLKKASQIVSEGDNEFPNALLERLTDQEAQLVARVATEREPPVRDLEMCLQVLRFGRIERQLLSIQHEIDGRRSLGRDDSALDDLLREKNRLRSALERARRGPRDVYNK
jgi:DNA primase